MRQRTAVSLFLLLLLPPVFVLAQLVILAESTGISLYRGTAKVSDLPSWNACQARARELANRDTRISGTVTYSCKTGVRQVVATYAPNPQQPINCVVSAFTLQSSTAWGACTNGQQTRTETWTTRTVVTPASHGGTACQALAETRTATQACTVVTPPALLLDRFEYAVGREDSDKATAFRAAGWSGVKSNPLSNAHGYLYTVTQIPGFTGTFPGGGSRVLALEARPDTGFQSDFYLQLAGPTTETIPGEVWIQFWIYPQNHAPSGQVSQWSNRNKFLYVARDGYPSHLHNWMLGDTSFAYNPHNAAPWGMPSTGQFTWQLASASGGTSLAYTGPGSDPYRADIVSPQSLTEWMRPNRWTLVKMHFNTTGAQGVWEVWLQPQGGALVKVADWKGGITPGFQWAIPAGQRGGHRELRMPTTVGHATPTNPQHPYWLYMDDFVMTRTEADLQVYR